ncbi:hypothetical protein TKK_0002992 [Trichogramma kaykai]
MQIELKSISPEETNTIEIDDDTRDKDTEKVISDSPSITEADESRKRKAPTDAPPDDSDDSADEEDSVLFIREHQKKARLLVSKAITYSQDTLLSKKNNWAYFMSVDCIAHSEICHQLTDMGYLKTDSLKSHDMKLSMIIETGLDIGKSLFSIFIKDAHDHAVDTDIVNDALDRLADALKNHEIGCPPMGEASKAAFTNLSAPSTHRMASRPRPFIKDEVSAGPKPKISRRRTSARPHPGPIIHCSKRVPPSNGRSLLGQPPTMTVLSCYLERCSFAFWSLERSVLL